MSFSPCSISIIIISPALIILFDFDLIILPSFIIYSLGLQWAWQFNIIFIPIDIRFDSYCDHYIILGINKLIKTTKDSISYYSSRVIFDIWYLGHLSVNIYSQLFPLFRDRINLTTTRYLFDISQYILLPIYSFIRLFVYSFDVIHTLGFYSWGIKIDAIPGRINLATTLRLLWKGEYRGKCFESCGQGHLSMMINSLILFFFSIPYIFTYINFNIHVIVYFVFLHYNLQF